MHPYEFTLNFNQQQPALNHTHTPFLPTPSQQIYHSYQQPFPQPTQSFYPPILVGHPNPSLQHPVFAPPSIPPLNPVKSVSPAPPTVLEALDAFSTSSRRHTWTARELFKIIQAALTVCIFEAKHGEKGK